jgi:hypothetical protein
MELACDSSLANDNVGTSSISICGGGGRGVGAMWESVASVWAGAKRGGTVEAMSEGMGAVWYV